MKTLYTFLLMLSLSLTTVIHTSAQTSPQMPPPVLQILCEEIKAGRNAAHEKLETGYVQAFSQAKWPFYWLGMTSNSGANQAWYLTPYESFAAVENAQKELEKAPVLLNRSDQLDEQDSEFRTGQRVMLAVFRKDLSFHPERLMPSLPTSHYFSVIALRRHPGRDVEFTQGLKLYFDAMEKANVSYGTAIYEVYFGAQGDMFLTFTAIKSLAEFDQFMVQDKAIIAALGQENGLKLLKLTSDSILSSEATVFNFSPKMSYISKEFAAADPDFWLPKLKVVPKTQAKPEKQTAKNK